MPFQLLSDKSPHLMGRGISIVLVQLQVWGVSIYSSYQSARPVLIYSLPRHENASQNPNSPYESKPLAYFFYFVGPLSSSPVINSRWYRSPHFDALWGHKGHRRGWFPISSGTLPSRAGRTKICIVSKLGGRRTWLSGMLESFA